tara:strand:- start:3829 stop:4251 length:423 start_codon:yes stop_codon:yes gene_type:complete
MRFLTSKKASTAVIILATFLIAIALYIIMSYSSRECNINTDCGDDFYCGSDFKCHEMKIVERTVIKNELITPSIILTIGLIITALIINIDKLRGLNIKSNIKKAKSFINNKFFTKQDFPEKKHKDNYANITNPKEFGEYR